MTSGQVLMIPNVQIQNQVANSLVESKKYMGRTSTKNHPVIGMKEFDRLLPSTEMPDVHQFEARSPPFIFYAWRGCPKHMRLLHASPILEIEGVSTEPLFDRDLSVAVFVITSVNTQI